VTTLKGWSTTQEGTLLETSGAQNATAGFSTASSGDPNNAPYQFDPEFLSGTFSAADSTDDEDDIDLAAHPCSCPCPCSCFCARPNSTSSERAVKIVCRACGSNDIGALHAHNGPSSQARSAKHVDLVRSVVLGERFVVSGSYDKTIKIWDRRSGTLVADLTGGHTGRILCIAFDKTKVVSCGEDYVCVFHHGLIVAVSDGVSCIADMHLGFRPRDRYEFYLFVVRSIGACMYNAIAKLS